MSRLLSLVPKIESDESMEVLKLEPSRLLYFFAVPVPVPVPIPPVPARRLSSESVRIVLKPSVLAPNIISASDIDPLERVYCGALANECFAVSLRFEGTLSDSTGMEDVGNTSGLMSETYFDES